MLNAAIRGIIDLLKLRKDVKKTDLEIAKLERENGKAESLIQRASMEDIQRYDQATRERLELAARIQRERPIPLPPESSNASGPSWLIGILLLATIVYVLFKLFA